MFAAADPTEVGHVVLGLVAVGQLYTIYSNIVDRKREKERQSNGKGWVTRDEFKELRTRFELFISERRRDMDFLLSQLGSARTNIANLAGRVKVLYIEDSDTDRLLFRRAMASMFEIHEAATLSQAISMMAQDRYDAVLLDLNLPDCHGEETLRMFREQCPSACAIVVTGNSNPNLVQMAYDMGYESTIFKETEFDGKEFGSKITAAVLRHRKR